MEIQRIISQTEAKKIIKSYSEEWDSFKKYVDYLYGKKSNVQSRTNIHFESMIREHTIVKATFLVESTFAIVYRMKKLPKGNWYSPFISYIDTADNFTKNGMVLNKPNVVKLVHRLTNHLRHATIFNELDARDAEGLEFPNDIFKHIDFFFEQILIRNELKPEWIVEKNK